VTSSEDDRSIWVHGITLRRIKLVRNASSPSTARRDGFILASCYFGGAIATELSHGPLAVSPFIPIVLLWIGAFIRDRSIFF
jgi:hypothetical protein